MFGFDCALSLKEKKKGKRKSRERKTKKGPDVSTSLFAFNLLLSSQLMCVSFFVVVVFCFLFFSLVFFCCCCFCLFVFGFVSFLFCSFSLFCHFLLVFNLLFVKINKKHLGVYLKKKKRTIAANFTLPPSALT